jgi:guanylate kinase
VTVNEAFKYVQKERPQIVVVNGKTSTGKTTFAHRLKGELDYGMVEMDRVVRDAVIRPLDLPDTGRVHVEVYKHRNRPDWIAPFLAALQRQARHCLTNGHPVVIDGTMPNVTTLQEMLAPLPPAEIIYIHPAKLETYKQYLMRRFELTDSNHNAGLPPSFWRNVDDSEFRKFCQTRKLTPELVRAITEYAAYGQQSSNERLAELERHFKNIRIVEI